MNKNGGGMNGHNENDNEMENIIKKSKKQINANDVEDDEIEMAIQKSKSSAAQRQADL